MKGKMAIIIAIGLISVIVGVGFAAQTVTQHVPRVKRHIQITLACDTVSNSTDIPDVGAEGIIRFACPGSAAAGKCTFNDGQDCAFTVGNGKGGGGGFTTPTFTLPTGYVHIWVKGAALGAGLDPVADCAQFDDATHQLTSGTPVFLGNISHVYCAHLDADTGDLAMFNVSWS